MKTKRPLPIGIDSYKKIIDKPYYYVDKTLLIKDILDKGGEVNLFTRPRRFGKTLALTMLQSFFEKEIDNKGAIVDNSKYFQNTKIAATGKGYMQHMGQYPVIFLTLKSAKQPNFEMAYASLTDEIQKEYYRHRYVLDANALSDMQKEAYQNIMNGKAEAVTYAKSLQFLSECLKQCHNKNTIILLDEYDVPLENAYFRGFYTEMIDFIRSLFESALKTNPSLEFAVITGCLQLSKESIFTGLNNLKINSLLANDFAEHFGFTEAEVQQMLCRYSLEYRSTEAKEWYDGYQFGSTEVYNPWSMISYVQEGISNEHAFPKPYWSNTSSNSIIKELVERADDDVKEEIETLMQGGRIEVPVHEDITYEDIHKTQDNLWNFLFFTGYLKKTAERFENRMIYLTLTIPNEEVAYIYENTIREWFDQKIEKLDRKPLHQALLGGGCDEIQQILRRELLDGISYHDNAESFYHGYVAGLLKGMPDYKLRSNREAGNGRPDIQLVPYNQKDTVFLIELKKADSYQQMEGKCKEALAQIVERGYEEELRLEGYRNFVHYGICFCKKNCMVQMKK